METEQQAQEKHLAPRGRSLVVPIRSIVLTPLSRALDWCFPWTSWNYPGVQRGTLSLLPRPYNKSIIGHWRRGERGVPLDVLRAVSAYIRSRCLAGLSIAQELDDYANAKEGKPKHNQGFMKVRERNGITSDARGRGARKKTSI